MNENTFDYINILNRMDLLCYPRHNRELLEMVNLWRGRVKMKKISFICLAGLDQFIDPIIEGLSDNYNIRKFIIRDQQEIYNAIDWADIVWLEWANQSAIVGTNYKGIKGKKVIVRLHGYESLSNMPKQVNWGSVNRLIFVAPNVLKIMKNSIPDIEEKVKIKLVYNGINLDKFQFKEREPGHDIAWIGFINHKKNPPMALQILKKLTKGLLQANPFILFFSLAFITHDKLF